jgi:hypothetical protein
VILWDLADLLFVRDHAAQIACARSDGGLDSNEWTQFASARAKTPMSPRFACGVSEVGCGT